MSERQAEEYDLFANEATVPFLDDRPTNLLAEGRNSASTPGIPGMLYLDLSESCDETQPVTTIRDDDSTTDEHNSPRYLDLSEQSCDETRPTEDPAEGESSSECEDSSEGENDVDDDADAQNNGGEDSSESEGENDEEDDADVGKEAKLVLSWKDPRTLANVSRLIAPTKEGKLLHSIFMQSHPSDVARSRRNLRFGDTLSQSTLSDTEAIAEADEAIEWYDDEQEEEQQQQEQNSDDERSNPSPSHASSPSRARSPSTASLAGSQMQPGDAQTRAFYFCTGCHNTITKKRPPTFRCLKNDPNIRGTLINSNLFDRSVFTDEIALKWFVAHDLVWVPKPKEVVKNGTKSEEFKCKLHTEPKTVASRNTKSGGISYRCITKGCQKSYSSRGPILTNYKNESAALILEIYIRWAMRRDIQMSSVTVDPKTVSKHVRKLEYILASWMVGHRVSLGRKSSHVEVDESHFGHRKGGRGLMRAKTFVLETLVVVNQLGQTTDFACAPIDGKGWKHLEGLIKTNTPRETPVATDMLRGYTKIGHTHTHTTVNHSKTYVNAVNGTSTNNIESFHGKIKKCLRRRGANLNNCSCSNDRTARVLATAGVCLGATKEAEWGGNGFVWMFQALAEVIRQQLPVFDERRAERAKYFKKLNKGAVASRDKRTADAKKRVAEKDAAEAAAEAAAAANTPTIPVAAANTPTTPVVAAKKKGRGPGKKTLAERERKEEAERNCKFRRTEEEVDTLRKTVAAQAKEIAAKDKEIAHLKPQPQNTTTRPPALSEEEIERQRKLEKKAEEERSELREAYLSWHAAIAYFRLRAEPTFGQDVAEMDVDLRSRNNERMIAVKNVFSCPIFARNALRKAVMTIARFGRHLKMSADELEFMESGV